MNRKTQEGIVEVTRALAIMIRRRIGRDSYPFENSVATSAFERACHLLWCCEQIEKFVHEGLFGKAMRWLGFVQCGVAWCLSAASIEDMAKMNQKAKLGGTL
jgi:hypothetical protein